MRLKMKKLWIVFKKLRKVAETILDIAISGKSCGKIYALSQKNREKFRHLYL